MRLSLTLLLITIATGVTRAETPADTAFDWQAWRGLAVQDGGRYKPLDTLAWETLRTLSNRARFVAPGGGEALDSTAVYLSMLFDWPGWDREADPHAMAVDGGSLYFAGFVPDKWDKAPMLRVDYLALRDALGMPDDEKYISPFELSEAVIRDPHSNTQTPFLAWARECMRTEQERGLTAFEQKGVELAGKFLAYQDHRMGRRLNVLPVPGSEDRHWTSIAELMQANLNDQNDPNGVQRAVVEQFRAARQAYLADDPE